MSALSGACGITGRRRNPRNDRLQHLRHAFSLFRADRQGIGWHPAGAPREIECLVPSTSALARSILLMTGMIVRLLAIAKIHIGNRLRLHALRGIDEQERAFASRQAPRDFIGKVDVARRIDQMQGIRLPILGLIPNGHCMGFDRDAAFTLQVHRIKDLVFCFSGSDCASGFQEPVSEG